MVRRIPDKILSRSRELRKESTEAEHKLWQHLRNRGLSSKFRRQHPVGPFILDFYCHEAKLGVEVDGGGHAEVDQAEYDSERSKALAGEGIRVLRFWNSDVMKNVDGVVEAIRTALDEAK
jgi:very-short-patch-repair endonuclease